MERNQTRGGRSSKNTENGFSNVEVAVHHDDPCRKSRLVRTLRPASMSRSTRPPERHQERRMCPLMQEFWQTFRTVQK